MPGPEALLVARIRARVLALDPEAWVVKISGGPYQSAGLPDLLVISHGRVLGLEVKAQRPGESIEHLQARVTERQRHTLEAIRRAGGVAAVVWEPEQVDPLISNL